MKNTTNKKFPIRKKVTIALILLLFAIMAVVAFVVISSDIFNASATNFDDSSLSDNTIYSTATLEDDFDDDLIMIVLTRSARRTAPKLVKPNEPFCVACLPTAGKSGSLRRCGSPAAGRQEGWIDDDTEPIGTTTQAPTRPVALYGVTRDFEFREQDHTARNPKQYS